MLAPIVPSLLRRSVTRSKRARLGRIMWWFLTSECLGGSGLRHAPLHADGQVPPCNLYL